MESTLEVNDIEYSELDFISPSLLKSQYPISANEKFEINKFRKTICDIIDGNDPRLLVICGPCSIHDPYAAIEYAQRLKRISEKVEGQIFIVMRAYLEKPRTVSGWKGLINDPNMDGSCNIEQGLKVSRDFLTHLVQLGIPLATEVLDPNISHYFNDIFSWAAVGARTAESQIHRELASGLSMPVGYKNTTSGSVLPAIHAIQSSSLSHSYIGVNEDGKVCLIRTPGNSHGHIILRGGKSPNYSHEHVIDHVSEMKKMGVRPNVVVDCSHGNSEKDFRRQSIVADSVITQITQGNRHIVGLMLESHLHEGNQPILVQRELMKYGVSITDGCISWQETEKILLDINQKMKKVNTRKTSE
ncbi:3-deoxy-7-phosphoheptulonate synthase [Photobacterium sp. CAU 1568]|uniref:Phospho-2-dehydro-3-deoxyheptonate aldolase n=1 Tax=Photobacterium arenosum TaxID=2774143 RepID=A0ABR9BMW8_9GAMM|nr:3-deoxy-7-phosphoheptulonate synthase [Photobacterium arenosum]MBD8513563.1 3-deoxy-7-phosphoheptulonate synthase [Photobacterium arenosum]